MLKLIGSLFKAALFSLLILALGNRVHWNGITLSDQVRIGMAHAENTGIFEKIKDWAQDLTEDVRKGAHQKLKHSETSEEIRSSERQKLKALIQELNSSRKE